ncbi:MAG: triose-phosphate isomerase [Candidatus Nomurabacteria bacterium]|nr:MAG: triose-phosphate isomerase [Candidatus Nomurabacteria bacterium]
MKTNKPLIVANWKLNPTKLSDAKTLFAETKKKVAKITEAIVAIAPPVIFIPEVAKTVKNNEVKIGVQNVFYEERGPFTGEVAPGMVEQFGVSYVIIGHSERRKLGVTDKDVNLKIKAVLKKKMTPIVCIGERSRDDQGAFFGEVENEIKALAEDLSSTELKKVVIAYEPIWAIGTGKTATAEDVKEMQLFIVSTLTKLYDRKTAENIHLLYGGSVKASLAKNLHEQGGMNGFLVGGASLKATEFAGIVKAAID